MRKIETQTPDLSYYNPVVMIKCLNDSKGTLKPVECQEIQGIFVQHPCYKITDTRLMHSADNPTSLVCPLYCLDWQSKHCVSQAPLDVQL